MDTGRKKPRRAIATWINEMQRTIWERDLKPGNWDDIEEDGSWEPESVGSHKPG